MAGKARDLSANASEQGRGLITRTCDLTFILPIPFILSSQLLGTFQQAANTTGCDDEESSPVTGKSATIAYHLSCSYYVSRIVMIARRLTDPCIRPLLKVIQLPASV
jgi:hypothetical protein